MAVKNRRVVRVRQVQANEAGLFDNLLERINAIPDDQVGDHGGDPEGNQTVIASLTLQERKFFQVIEEMSDVLRRKSDEHELLHESSEHDEVSCAQYRQEVQGLLEQYKITKEIFWALLRLKYPGHEKLKLVKGGLLVTLKKTEEDELLEMLGGGKGLGQLMGLLQLGGRDGRGN